MMKDVGDVVHRVCVKFLRLVDEKYANLTQVLPEPDEHKKTKSSLKLASIKPVLRDVKDGAELVVAGSQLFAIIAGLFA